MIICSMLALLVCIGSVFLLITHSMQAQEERSLASFSDEMLRLNIEEKKKELHSNTVQYLNLLQYISTESPFMFDPGSQEIFAHACELTVLSFESALQIYDEQSDMTIFMLSDDYYYSSDNAEKEQLESRLKSIYSDENLQSESECSEPDGVSWIKNSLNGDAYIETDKGLMSMAFISPMFTGAYNDPLRVGIIIEWNDKDKLVRAAQDLVSERTSTAQEMNREIFRKALLITAAAALFILLICFVYTGQLTRYIADPIELEQLRAKQEKEALEETNRMKTAFLSDASHELKTPLAAMSGYAQNAEIELSNGTDTDVVREKLKRISSEANRMALMVTQILDATRIEEGRMILERSVCDMDSLVRETVETYFAVLNKNNNHLALRIPLELPEIEADRSRLQRVFVNLISNALKHTQNGTILIKAEEDDGFVKVTVKDTGRGISEEDMPHIWERYYKGKHSETGTGLGLFICKFIIESHGGKIWAESQLGKGTAFMFTLPVE